MAVSYSALIHDHEQIDHLVRLLYDDVFMLGKKAPEACRNLAQLLHRINQHIAAEKIVIDVIEAKGLTGVWGDQWIAVLSHVDDLRTDTARVLSTWNERAIEEDRLGFLVDLETFSAKCEMIAVEEVDCFYRMALEVGAIALR